MPIVNPYNTLLSKIFNYYAQDVGKSLIHLGALGWFLSAAAQLTMIYRNKDIDKKEKQFLLPQETADGVINVALYYTICQGIKYGCEQLLERGHVFTQRSMDTILALKPVPTSCADYIKGMSEIFYSKKFVKKKNAVGRLSDFYAGSLKFLSILTKKDTPYIEKLFKTNPVLAETFERIWKTGQEKQTMSLLNRALKEYTRFKNGVGVVAAVGASVLACNLITPITRNITANAFQKNSINKHKANSNETLKRPQITMPYNVPVSNTFSNFKI